MSKQETLGKKILQRIHNHDKDKGGVLTQTTGAMGSAKTAVNLSFTDYTLVKYPKEKIFWSECYNTPLQTFKLKHRDRIQFMVKNSKDHDIIFRDRDKHLKEANIKPIHFDTVEEVYELAKPGHVNVVFFGNRLEWMGLIAHLRGSGEWNHTYLEEFSEIAPAFPSGNLWKEVKGFANLLKDVRKCMMNVHYNTQQVSDIFYECKNKVMIKIFLPGSITENHCRITQPAIDNLNRDSKKGNQAWLVEGGEFGKIRFRDIYKPVPGYHYEAHINERKE